MENEASDKKNKTEKDGADEPGNLSVFVPGVSSTASIGDVYTESVSQTDEPPDPRNRDAFQQWLETKPREWSVVIAARAALRVLPLARTVQFGSEEARAILFPVFRANATARFAAMYPNLADGALTVAKFAELTAKMAAGAVPTADESPVAAAIAARAAARAAAADAARDAAYEAAYAAYAAADAADPEDDDACTAIRQDALDLKGGTPPDRLARAALWPTGAAELVFPSGNIGGHWSLLQNDLQRLGQHWDVWTGWYDEVLVGQPRSPARSEEWEAAFTDAHGSSHPWTAPLPWDDGPEAVNLAIKARLDTERQPRPRQAVESQLDEPTADDQLYRKPFAQALVERLDKLYSEHGRSQDMESNGFAAHIHAPWGAGKTSVLKMMRQLMIASDRKAPDGRIAPRWVVVDFNAWEHERRNPPWWPLIEQVKKECLKSLSDPKGRFAAFQLRARWIWWRSKTDFLPYLVAGFVALLCLWVFWEARSGTPPVGYSIGIGHTTSSNPGPNTAIIEWVIKLSAVIIAVFTAFLGASRFMAFGSTAAAQLFESISHDPLHRVTKLFRTIVEKTGMPVCVFVDDLDRCRVPYVVELLGGIQTLFRHSRIFYVVAADRGWIKASFESSYDTFGKSVGNAGQPLGYLFLEKVFQLSTPLPGIGGERRAEYLKRLLGGRHHDRDSMSDTAVPAGGPGIKQFDATVASAREEIRRKHGDDLTPEQGEAILKADPSSEARTAVMLELNVSRAAEKEAKHLLESFVGILPDNPRVMKRMINALAMRQAIDRLEQNEVPAAVLARWTILEQWWPALADLLIEHPEWIEQLRQGISEADNGKLAELQPFADSAAVRDIVGEPDDDGLTTAHVRIITRGSAT